MEIQSFSIATEIHIGDGALEVLSSLCGKQVMVVADPAMTQLGFTERVCGLARQAGAATTIFDAVEPDPSQETCAAGVELAEEFAPDTIIGLGGGSTLDVTKTIRAACETPNTFRYRSSWPRVSIRRRASPVRSLASPFPPPAARARKSAGGQ